MLKILPAEVPVEVDLFFGTQPKNIFKSQKAKKEQFDPSGVTAQFKNHQEESVHEHSEAPKAKSSRSLKKLLLNSLNH